MNKWKPGLGAAALVLTALLVGGVSLSTVGQQPDEPQAEEGEVTDRSPQDPAAAPVAAAPATSAVAVEEPSNGRMESILRLLATSGAVPPEIQDPAFDYYVDLTLLGNAWADLDAALLTDLVLQFMEGERVLLRPHRAVRSSELLEVATRLAAIKGDEKTLTRLEKAVERTKSEGLAAEFTQARAVATDALAGETVWTVPVETTSAAAFARYKGFLQDIVAALVVRDRSILETLQKELATATDLPVAHREKLGDRIKAALAAIPEEDEQASRAANVLDKLAHSTRNPLGRPPSVVTPSPGANSPGFNLGTLLQALPLRRPWVGDGSLQTMEPTGTTVCCQQDTLRPDSQTHCCQETFQPDDETYCCQQTQQPTEDTRCCQDTFRPDDETRCCQQTQQPTADTRCCQQTQQPTAETWCCQQTQQPTAQTWCCQQTQQPTAQTWCCQQTQQPTAQTWCCQQTQQPTWHTQCRPPQQQTQRPTGKGKGCITYPTQFPANCGQQQQQQQKQRWIPHKGKYTPGGGSQQQFSPGQDSYGAKPFSRRTQYGGGY